MNRSRYNSVQSIRKRIRKSLQAFSLLVLFLSLGSCSVKKIVYFNDLQVDSAYVTRQVAPYTEPRVQVDDILQVSIQTIDPATSQVVNQAVQTQAVGASSASSTGNQVISGFLVDKDGHIHLNLLGQVSVVGLTTQETREKILGLAKAYYNEPTVQVRFANFKVTVLGEVTRPASYILPNEKVSILDVLGMAGDLTIYGRRDNVLLIREAKGQKEMVRLDLNDSHIVSSQYFYLRQNDVLYIEPGKAKAAANNTARTQTYALAGAALSLLVVIFSRWR